MDVTAGVSTLTLADVYFEICEIFGSKRALVRECAGCVYTAGAADKDFRIILRIEIEEDFTVNHSFTYIICAGKPGFLINGEERGNRTVHKFRLGKDCKRSSNSDAVVGSKGSAVGPHPFPVNDSGDRCSLKVKTLVIALAHHVHVSLEDDFGSILMPGSCGFAHKHVADLVGLVLDVVLLRKINKEFPYLTLLFRGAGHLCDFVKNLEDSLRFKFFYCHNYIRC